MAEQASSTKATTGAKQAAAKKRIRKGVTRGIAHVKATFNNTMITITDTNGETISWASAGTAGCSRAREGHTVSGAAGRGARGQRGAQARDAGSGSEGQGAGRRSGAGNS